METPVAIGVVLVMVLMIGLSEWFYGVAQGLRELVLDDKFYGYRIAGASLVSILFMFGAFVGIATIAECPNEERVGIFSGLKCDKYLEIKTSAEQMFQPKNKTVDQTLQ